MSAEIVYEIAYFDSEGDGAVVLDCVQLVSVDGVLRLRKVDGSEAPCESEDIAAVISSTPALREIRAGQEIRISCDSEVAAILPFVLEPVLDGRDSGDCHAKVNGADWMAFPTLVKEHVMLPGSDQFEGPDLSSCWATLSVEEGEWNPLFGFTSIGVVTPGVAVEFGRCDPGGLGSVSAVAISQFDDFATIFVEWLLNWEVLAAVWYGDEAPTARTVQLFDEAAAAANNVGGWSTEMDEDDRDDDDNAGDDSDDEDEDDDEDTSHHAAAYLELFLSDGLVEQVRARLKSLK
jgi:hypothetical protein